MVKEIVSESARQLTTAFYLLPEKEIMIQQSRQHEYPKIPELSKTTLNPVVAAGGIEVATIGVEQHGHDVTVCVFKGTAAAVGRMQPARLASTRIC